MLEMNGDLLRLGLSGGDDGHRGDDDDNLTVMLKIVVIVKMVVPLGLGGW